MDKWPGMVAHTYNPRGRRLRYNCELEGSQGYMVSPRPAWLQCEID